MDTKDQNPTPAVTSKSSDIAQAPLDNAPDASARLEPALGCAVQRVDKPRTAVVFQLRDKCVTGGIVGNEDLGPLARRLLAAARGVDAAASGDRKNPLPEPLPATRIGFGRGRTDDEAVMVIETGAAALTFAVSSAQLAQLCRRFLGMQSASAKDQA